MQSLPWSVYYCIFMFCCFHFMNDMTPFSFSLPSLKVPKVQGTPRGCKPGRLKFHPLLFLLLSLLYLFSSLLPSLVVVACQTGILSIYSTTALPVCITIAPTTLTFTNEPFVVIEWLLKFIRVLCTACRLAPTNKRSKWIFIHSFDSHTQIHDSSVRNRNQQQYIKTIATTPCHQPTHSHTSTRVTNLVIGITTTVM